MITIDVFLRVIRDEPNPREGVPPYKRLMEMCCWWMGSHFYDWIDCNGVAHFRTFGGRKFLIFTVSKRTRIFVL